MYPSFSSLVSSSRFSLILSLSFCDPRFFLSHLEVFDILTIAYVVTHFSGVHITSTFSLFSLFVLICNFEHETRRKRDREKAVFGFICIIRFDRCSVAIENNSRNTSIFDCCVYQ